MVGELMEKQWLETHEKVNWKICYILGTQRFLSQKNFSNFREVWEVIKSEEKEFEERFPAGMIYPILTDEE